jgi:3-oxoacyl-[acyl-carrier-protein] synthase II
MNLLNIAVAGGAWITASGVGCMNSGDNFCMSNGVLPNLRRELLSSAPEQRWGRLDHFSKIGLVAASLALRDAGLNPHKVPASTAVITSTVGGSVDVDHEYFRTVVPQSGLFASPNLFAYTLPNCMIGEISIRYGLTGPAMVVSQTTPDMMTGIISGAKLISYGLCERVIAGYCDTEAGIRCVETLCKPGAVFLVLAKTDKKSPLTLRGSELIYNGRVLRDLSDLMGELTHDKLAELKL